MIEKKYLLAELLDVKKLDVMLTQLYEIANIPSAITSLDGEVLTQAGWQTICSQFHRGHPDSAKACLESDTRLLHDLSTEASYRIYTCPHGLVDAISPIKVENRHVANVFIGQLLHEPVTDIQREAFRRQAKKYNYDETIYLQALEKVPIIPHDVLTRQLKFISQFVCELASVGLLRLREKKQALSLQKNEKLLRDSRIHLKAAFESMSDAIFISDTKGNFIDFNTSFASFHKFKSKDECYRSLSEFQNILSVYLPDGSLLPLDLWVVSRTLRGETGINEEYVLQRNDTGEKWNGSYSYAPMYDMEKDNIIGSVVVARDITKQKIAEEDLSRQKSLFETMFNTIPDGVIITDTNRNIQIANRGMENTFGYKPDELVGKNTEILYADRDKYLQTGEAVFGTNSREQDDRFITHYKNNNGLEFPCETFGAKLFDENKCWLGNLGIMHDITERLLREEEGLMLQKQLFQAQKMEAIGVLAGGIAHDFNNILSAILGHSQMVLEQLSPSDTIYDDIQQILLSGNRAADLVKRILLFSRQETEELQTIEVQSLLKEVIELFRPSIPSSIELVESISLHCGAIIGNPTQLHQIMMNLFTNAKQAIGSNYGTISVALSEVSPSPSLFLRHSVERTAEKYVCIDIHDSGCGIPTENQQRIFDPFFTTKAQDEGTGLGLAVVDGIVRKHSGLVTLESSPNEGTTFQIYLPVDGGIAEPAAQAVSHVSKGSENVLLVDDEEKINKLNTRFLTKQGYQVTSFTDSEKALEHFIENPHAYDIVVTDMTMPKLTGIDLIKEVVRHHPRIKSVLCTGYSASINESQAIKMGADAYLTKPLIPRKLAETMRKVIDHG